MIDADTFGSTDSNLKNISVQKIRQGSALTNVISNQFLDVEEPIRGKKTYPMPSIQDNLFIFAFFQEISNNLNRIFERQEQQIEALVQVIDRQEKHMIRQEQQIEALVQVIDRQVHDMKKLSELNESGDKKIRDKEYYKNLSHQNTKYLLRLINKKQDQGNNNDDDLDRLQTIFTPYFQNE